VFLWYNARNKMDITNQAKQLIQEKHFTEAENILSNTLSQDPSNAEAWQLLGSVLFSLQKKDEAFAAFEKAATLAPNDPTALFNYGVALQMASRNAEAKQQFEAALRQNPSHTGATQRLALLAFSGVASPPVPAPTPTETEPPAMAPMGMTTLSGLGGIGGNSESASASPQVYYTPPTDDDYPPSQIPDPPTSYKSGRHNHTQESGDAGRLTTALIVGFVMGALCCYGWWWVVSATGLSLLRILPAAGIGWLIGIAINMTYQKDDDKAAGAAALIAFLLLTPTLILVWTSARYSTVLTIAYSIIALIVGVSGAYKTNMGLDFDDSRDD
jgi:tetratricopeptide (TPR) repeat protein